MSLLSAKTIAEMEEGARTLAKHQGRPCHHDDEMFRRMLESAKSVQERAAALKRWQREGLLYIHTSSRPNYDHEQKGEHSIRHQITHYVLKSKWAHNFELPDHDQIFATYTEDPIVLAYGGYPSELLVAQIALAIASVPRDDGNG